MAGHHPTISPRIIRSFSPSASATSESPQGEEWVGAAIGSANGGSGSCDAHRDAPPLLLRSSRLFPAPRTAEVW